jgi:hypothetical protein
VAITRVAELRKVFRGGESELLNGIARLAILYEDLRLEMNEFRRLQKLVVERDEPDTDNRTPYFLRNAIGTLAEFGRGLNVIRVSLSELFGIKSSTLFGRFALLGGRGSRPCEEPTDGGWVDSE